VSILGVILRPSLKYMGSVTWEDLGNNLCAGRVSLKDFRKYFSQGPASLHDIQVIKVQIVDHLGQNIPVPIAFCSSWNVRLSWSLV
jgi:hypothetical protein